MNPLFRNDKPGQYPPSWYAASTALPPERPALRGDRTADVCVIGAGYTGLWAARTLAERGFDTVVLEAHRVGFGASGRNGGQVGTGFNKSQRWLEKHLGEGQARALWSLAEEAKAMVRDFAAEHPEVAYRPGVAHGAYSASEAAQDFEEADHLLRRYNYARIEPLDRAAMQALVRTPLYHGGTLDRGAGHIHPLRYAVALAAAAEKAGAHIYERSVAQDIHKGGTVTIRTGHGAVRARHVILAGNGYLPDIAPQVNARVMPINSFIAATEPLGPRAREVLAEDIAVADSKFVVNYYRFSEDDRFLFGGRESYTIGFPADIQTALVRRMTHLFPQLRGVKVDHVWGGTLGITMSRLPAIQKVAPNILSGAGFSGHGVALSGLAGRVMAEAVDGQAGRFDTFAALPATPFPGGTTLRAPLLALAMTWFSLRDRLGL